MNVPAGRERLKDINIVLSETKRADIPLHLETSPEIGRHSPEKPITSELGASALNPTMDLELLPGDGDSLPLSHPFSRAA